MALEDLFKILLAIAAGGIVGIEREFRDKAAGFRTLIFICLGATLYTIFSLSLGERTDPTRIAANIISGVGFLGAGVILRERGRVIGLTTASIIWLVAAIGMGIGGGEYGLTFAAVGIMLIVLWGFPAFENFIDKVHEERAYEIAFPTGSDKIERLEASFRRYGLRVRERRHTKAGDEISFQCRAAGGRKNHQLFIRELLSDPEVNQFRF